jgi:hypothetical protein
MKTLSLKQYGELIGCTFEPNTLEQIQEFAQDELDITLWDYPLAEIDHAKDVCGNVVLVDTDFGLRVCELIN